MANKANLANSVLFAPLSDSATSLQVYAGDGSLFPAAPFYLTISPKNKWSRKINSEIVLVTAKSTDTFTITRAQKSTTAKAFEYGDLLAIGIYKEDLDDLKTDVMQALMPVGFVVTLGVSTNPGTLYGFGTWTAITGKVVVGISGSDTEFDTLNETGGAKTHTLSTTEMPVHTHDFRYIAGGSGGGINDTYNIPYNPSSNGSSFTQSGQPPTSGQTRNGVLNAGSGGAHNNLQPYIVKYVWERTA
jgi:hypothetical protein